MNNTINEILELRKYWKRKRGLFALLLFVLITHITTEKYLKDVIEFGNDKLILLLLLFSYILFWLIVTNRLPFFNRNRLNIFLSIDIDDEEYISIIDDLISRSISEVMSHIEMNPIKIKVLPINTIKNVETAKNWIEKNKNLAQAIVQIKLKTGNESGDSKILFNDITFIGYLNDKDINIGGSTLNGLNEFAILLNGRNWEYKDKNSFDDKENIKSNLTETFYYYSAISLIYKTKINEAIKILKILYNPTNSIVKSEKFADRINFMITKKNIESSRQNLLLFNTSIELIQKYVQNEDFEKAKFHFEFIDTLNVSNNQAPQLYILKAYYYYKIGDIDSAIDFSRKLLNDNRYGNFYITNMLFLSKITNEFNLYEKMFLSINTNIKNVNMIEILAFYSKEKNNPNLDEVLFEFSETLLEICFLGFDSKQREEKIKNLNLKYGNNLKFTKLLKHLQNICLKEKRREDSISKKIRNNLNSTKAA